MQQPQAYYNEFDPFAAEWLRNLIKAGVIAPGLVDQRSILDVTPNDLRGFTQCHFFAGIGVWSHSLREAGWSDDRPVWTGSPPCQPFSVAGQGAGTLDERHLWPAFFHLIEQCRPDVVFGEQVEAAIKHNWLDLVQDDLEGIGYSFGAVGLPAASVGAPHIRQRLWFVADKLEDAVGVRRRRWRDGDSSRNGGTIQVAGRSALDALGNAELHGHIGTEIRRSISPSETQGRMLQPEGHATIGELADGVDERSQGRLRGRQDSERQAEHGHIRCDGPISDMADDPSKRREECEQLERDVCEAVSARTSDDTRSGTTPPGPTNGFWGDADWLYCKDKKWRPAQPEIFPLAYGITNNLGILRGAGNAIVSQVAQEIIKAYDSITTIEE